MSNKDLSRRDFIHTAGKAGMAAGLTGSVLTTLCLHSTGTVNRCHDHGNTLYQTRCSLR
jgi:hypothetical protein